MALVLLKRAGYDAVVIVMLPVFLAAILWSARAPRRRDETSAGYTARMGYRDPDHPINAWRSTRDPVDVWCELKGFD